MSRSFRRDISVGHDSCAIALTSRANVGCCEGIEPGSPEWMDGVERGEFLPIALDGDRGGTCVRVLLESPLSGAEEEEMVDCFVGRLAVDDGRLVVCGSTDFLDEQQFLDSDMVQEVKVPKGLYRVDVYACFIGINGRGADHGTTLGPDHVATGAWFRRTRPGEPFPLWLRLQCYAEPACDPGHEAEWAASGDEASDLDEDGSTTWVDFVIRLTRADSADAAPTAPIDEGGFVPVRVDRKTPERCPLGLRAELPGD